MFQRSPGLAVRVRYIGKEQVFVISIQFTAPVPKAFCLASTSATVTMSDTPLQANRHPNGY